MTYRYQTKYHSNIWKVNFVSYPNDSTPKKNSDSYTSPLSGRTLAKESSNHTLALVLAVLSSAQLRTLTQYVSKVGGGDKLRVVRTGVDAL